MALVRIGGDGNGLSRIGGISNLRRIGEPETIDPDSEEGKRLRALLTPMQSRSPFGNATDADPVYAKGNAIGPADRWRLESEQRTGVETTPLKALGGLVSSVLFGGDARQQERNAALSDVSKGAWRDIAAESGMESAAVAAPMAGMSSVPATKGKDFTFASANDFQIDRQLSKAGLDPNAIRAKADAQMKELDARQTAYDPKTVLASAARWAADQELAKRTDVKARAAETLAGNEKGLGFSVIGGGVSQLPYMAQFMLGSKIGPLGLAIPLMAAYDRRYAENRESQYAFDKATGELKETRAGLSATEAVDPSAMGAVGEVAVETAGGKALSMGLGKVFKAAGGEKLLRTFPGVRTVPALRRIAKAFGDIADVTKTHGFLVEFAEEFFNEIIDAALAATPEYREGGLGERLARAVKNFDANKKDIALSMLLMQGIQASVAVAKGQTQGRVEKAAGERLTTLLTPEQMKQVEQDGDLSAMYRYVTNQDPAQKKAMGDAMSARSVMLADEVMKSAEWMDALGDKGAKSRFAAPDAAAFIPREDGSKEYTDDATGVRILADDATGQVSAFNRNTGKSAVFASGDQNANLADAYRFAAASDIEAQGRDIVNAGKRKALKALLTKAGVEGENIILDGNDQLAVFLETYPDREAASRMKADIAGAIRNGTMPQAFQVIDAKGKPLPKVVYILDNIRLGDKGDKNRIAKTMENLFNTAVHETKHGAQANARAVAIADRMYANADDETKRSFVWYGITAERGEQGAAEEMARLAPSATDTDADKADKARDMRRWFDEGVAYYTEGGIENSTAFERAVRKIKETLGASGVRSEKDIRVLMDRARRAAQGKVTFLDANAPAPAPVAAPATETAPQGPALASAAPAPTETTPAPEAQTEAPAAAPELAASTKKFTHGAVARSYFFESGAGAMQSVGYLFNALSGTFPRADAALYDVYQKHKQTIDKYNDDIRSMATSAEWAAVKNDIAAAIEREYTVNPSEARAIAELMLGSPTGVSVKQGKAIERRLDTMETEPPRQATDAQIVTPEEAAGEFAAEEAAAVPQGAEVALEEPATVAPVEPVAADVNQRFTTEPIGKPEERATVHRVFDGGSPIAVKGEDVLPASDESYAYRLTGQPQIDDMKASGQVRAKEGKMRGGRSGETQWSRGNATLGYRAGTSDGKYVIVAPAEGLDRRMGGLPTSAVTKVYKAENGKWVDVSAGVLPRPARADTEAKLAAAVKAGEPVSVAEADTVAFEIPDTYFRDGDVYRKAEKVGTTPERVQKTAESKQVAENRALRHFYREKGIKGSTSVSAKRIGTTENGGQVFSVFDSRDTAFGGENLGSLEIYVSPEGKTHTTQLKNPAVERLLKQLTVPAMTKKEAVAPAKPPQEPQKGPQAVLPPKKSKAVRAKEALASKEAAPATEPSAAVDRKGRSPERVAQLKAVAQSARKATEGGEALLPPAAEVTAQEQNAALPPSEAPNVTGREQAAEPPKKSRAVRAKEAKAAEQAKAAPEAAVKVAVQPDGDKVVSVPSKDKAVVAPKEQKKYLIAEVAKALESAPQEPVETGLWTKENEHELNTAQAALREHDKTRPRFGGDKEYAAWSKENWKLADAVAPLRERKTRDQYRMVSIEVPGDGTFTIVDSKPALKDFADRAKNFPASEFVQKTSRPGTPEPSSLLQPKKPAIVKSIDADTAKALAPYVSEDPKRGAITAPHWNAEAGEAVATDGRKLAVIIGEKGGKTTDTGKPYPNYAMVVPGYRASQLPAADAADAVSVKADSGELSRKLFQANSVWEDKDKSHVGRVYVTADGTIEVSTSDVDTGEYTSLGDRQGFFVGHYDIEWLLDALAFMRRRGVTEPVFSFRGVESPLVITGKNEYVLMMPTRMGYDTDTHTGVVADYAAWKTAQPPAPQTRFRVTPEEDVQLQQPKGQTDEQRAIADRYGLPAITLPDSIQRALQGTGGDALSEDLRSVHREFQKRLSAPGKPADAVTYDDAGKVVPLSQRFNEATGDIRFRTTGANMDELARLMEIVGAEDAADFARFKGQDGKGPIEDPTAVNAETWRKVGGVLGFDIPTHGSMSREAVFRDAEAAITDESAVRSLLIKYKGKEPEGIPIADLAKIELLAAKKLDAFTRRHADIVAAAERGDDAQESFLLDQQNADMEFLEDAIVTAISGRTNWGRAGNAMNWGFDKYMNPLYRVMRRRKASGKDPTAAELAEVAKAHKEHTERLEKALADLNAAIAAERAKMEAGAVASRKEAEGKILDAYKRGTRNAQKSFLSLIGDRDADLTAKRDFSFAPDMADEGNLRFRTVEGGMDVYPAAMRDLARRVHAETRKNGDGYVTFADNFFKAARAAKMDMAVADSYMDAFLASVGVPAMKQRATVLKPRQTVVTEREGGKGVKKPSDAKRRQLAVERAYRAAVEANPEATNDEIRAKARENMDPEWGNLSDADMMKIFTKTAPVDIGTRDEVTARYTALKAQLADVLKSQREAATREATAKRSAALWINRVENAKKGIFPEKYANLPKEALSAKEAEWRQTAAEKKAEYAALYKARVSPDEAMEMKRAKRVEFLADKINELETAIKEGRFDPPVSKPRVWNAEIALATDRLNALKRHIAEQVEWDTNNAKGFSGKAINWYKRGADIYKFYKASWDASNLGVQSARLFAHSPIYGTRALGEALKASINEDTYLALRHQTETHPDFADAFGHGLAHGRKYDDMFGTGAAELLFRKWEQELEGSPNLAKRAAYNIIAGVNISQRMFEAYGDLMRLHVYSSIIHSPAVEAKGPLSDADKTAIANMVNILGGVGNTKMFSSDVANVLGRVMWSSRLFTAQLQTVIGGGGLLFNAGVGPEGSRSAMGRKWYETAAPGALRTYARVNAGNFALCLIAEALGRAFGDRQPWEDEEKGFWRAFSFLYGTRRAFGKNLDLTGKLTPWFALARKVAEGSHVNPAGRTIPDEGWRAWAFTISNFVRGRLRPDFAFAANLLFGKDLTGEPFGRGVEGWKRAALEGVLPIAIGDMFDTTQAMWNSHGILGFTVGIVPALATDFLGFSKGIEKRDPWYEVNRHKAHMGQYKKAYAKAAETGDWGDANELAVRYAYDIMVEKSVATMTEQANAAKKEAESPMLTKEGKEAAKARMEGWLDLARNALAPTQR